jgi:inosine triphosphate pyrophosphatase
MLRGVDDHTAYAQTVLAYSCGNTSDDPDQEDIILFEGRTCGKIVAPRGSRDFGWDCTGIPFFNPTKATARPMPGDDDDHPTDNNVPP